MRRAVLALLAVAVAACVTTAVGGFRNNYPHPEKAGLSEREFFVLKHGETLALQKQGQTTSSPRAAAWE